MIAAEHPPRRLPALALGLAMAAALLAGCSSSGSKSVDYRSSGSRPPQQSLEVPPELTNPQVDDRYAIPDPKAQTTYSAYSRDRGTTTPSAAAAGVLPKVDGVRLERAGDQRWLVVKTTPDKAWPIVREFWMDMGFGLRKESPEVGIMETDWAENRAKIPQDVIRSTLGKVVDGMWSTNERDKFRTRLETGTEPGTTEIFVSHRGMEEIYTSSQQERTVWQARPADRELEAEMLGRIMVKFGAEEKRVAGGAAPKATPTVAAAAAAGGAKPAAPVAIGNAVLQNAGAGPLVVNDGFDRAWRRVGLALDRVGFTVEDRDRSKGLFFVRYVDPEVDLKDTSKVTWTERLQFWKPTPKAAQPQYRISVSDAGSSMSQIEVLNSAGAKETSSTGKKILALLYDQLK